MATYSTFFASGLLAPETDRPSTPTTPTQSTDTKPTTAITQPAADERPSLRRRRSSLSIATSSVAAIKVPPGPRSAIHRQSLGRSRSGSIQSVHGDLSRLGNPAAAAQSNLLVGRLRSGSVGTALKPRRARKHATLPSPAPPPPTSPLPELPSLPHVPHTAVPISSIDTMSSTPRRPLTRRANTAETIPVPLMTPSATLPSSLERLSIASPLGTPFTTRIGVADYFSSEVRL